jgi:hypothetical protein
MIEFVWGRVMKEFQVPHCHSHEEGSGRGFLLKWNLPFAGSVESGVFEVPL